MPNLPIKHVLADGSTFEHCPDGSYKLWHVDGTVTDLSPSEGVALAIGFENRELLKRLLNAICSQGGRP